MVIKEPEPKLAILISDETCAKKAKAIEEILKRLEQGERDE